MAETPIFVATPFPSVSLDNGSETYFLLPFSTVSTIDGGGINALDAGSSSDSAVQNVFIDTVSVVFVIRYLLSNKMLFFIFSKQWLLCRSILSI